MSLVHAPLDCAVAPARRGAVAVLGNLDGVHLGHQALIGEARALAAEAGAPLAAVTFAPHPRRAFDPDTPPFLLTTLEQKAAILEGLGCHDVFALPFTPALYGLLPEAFVADILVGVLGLSGVVVGDDFRFGAKRAGDADALARTGAAHGLAVRALGVAGDAARKYSSTTAREALREGRPQDAAAVMGRPFAVTGAVLTGRKLARQLDFPTANVALGDLVRPLYGVYGIEADADGATYPGIANVGVRPTVDGETELLEAHLFGFDGDLYGRTITVRLERFIRPERRFDGVEDLRAQIARDVETASALTS